MSFPNFVSPELGTSSTPYAAREPAPQTSSEDKIPFESLEEPVYTLDFPGKGLFNGIYNMRIRDVWWRVYVQTDMKEKKLQDYIVDQLNEKTPQKDGWYLHTIPRRAPGKESPYKYEFQVDIYPPPNLAKKVRKPLPKYTYPGVQALLISVLNDLVLEFTTQEGKSDFSPNTAYNQEMRSAGKVDWKFTIRSDYTWEQLGDSLEKAIQKWLPHILTVEGKEVEGDGDYNNAYEVRIFMESPIPAPPVWMRS